MEMKRPGHIQEILISDNKKSMMFNHMESDREGGIKDCVSDLSNWMYINH